MVSSQHVKILLLSVAVLSLVSLMALPSSSTLAQGPPTPTNIPNVTPGGGGGDGGERPATPVPPGADLAGFVYDYSRGGPQPGVTVLLEGGGWRAETVSDSNGNYQFVNLGSGEGVLNLALPPGVHPAAPNWLVSFGSGGHVRVNLGYYGGDTPPMPVLLSSRLEGNMLLAQVENRTGQAATGGLVDIRLPVSLRASPAVQASQGAVDYSEHRVRVIFGELAPGTTVSISVSLEKVGAAMRRGRETAPTHAVDARGPGLASPLVQTSSSQIQVMFTYDQQITPQLVAVDPEQVSPVSQAETLMPITGNGLAVGGLLGMGLAIALLLVLAGAGWRSVDGRR